MTRNPNRRDICIHSRAPGLRRGALAGVADGFSSSSRSARAAAADCRIALATSDGTSNFARGLTAATFLTAATMGATGISNLPWGCRVVMQMVGALLLAAAPAGVAAGFLAPAAAAGGGLAAAALATFGTEEPAAAEEGGAATAFLIAAGPCRVPCGLALVDVVILVGFGIIPGGFCPTDAGGGCVACFTWTGAFIGRSGATFGVAATLVVVEVD
mmetsp:Transcript_44967/g.108706  ORF Transcript_44967/g.108706 Transcript_44967/m.108706 type:complete len:215 (+) Transcript_44967:361-1005(+)